MSAEVDPSELRTKTDEKLRLERETADDLLLHPDSAGRVVEEVVRERLSHAEEQIDGARKEADARLEAQEAVLPEVSDKLEQVAESLSQAATTLTGAAGMLKEATPVEVMSNVAAVAEQLKHTAGGIADADHPAPDASGQMAEQLAAIAEGIAEVTATLAEERRDVDETLRQERSITDRIIVQELEQVETAIVETVEIEHQILDIQREATDVTLAEERRQTDTAVRHVMALLGEEQHAHAVAADNYASRNEFLGIVSHDLRGPLMAISGAASVIERMAPPDERGREIAGWVASIKRSVGVMERLIRDLLDFGSFEDGGLRVVAQRLDIREVVRSAVDAFDAVAAASFIALTADLPDEPVWATFDSHRILQVLSNLLHNAIKFTPQNGTIRVRVARSGSHCLVSVSDTGTGIPASELTSIFERFRQLDASDHTGLGLGLYISMWIIEAHRGRIWAESQVGAGATFYFTLPE
jgi:signal transduction histidine kinase